MRIYGKSMRNGRNNRIVMEDNENELFCQLPPGVVFPESNAGVQSEKSSLQDQRLLVNLNSFD